MVVTLLGEGGKLRGVARKGKLPGGNIGRLSLFNDVTVQCYRRHEEDLALLTQVKLNGALPRLPHPDVYAYAHVQAELADALTVDVHVGENLYRYLASGLRGLARHHDPSAVSLIYAWKLLGQAGLSPILQRCARCGAGADLERFDVSAGGVTCARCGGGIELPEEAREQLVALAKGTVRAALSRPVADPRLHWTLLFRYVSYHVGELRSFDQIVELGPSLAPPVAS